MDDIQYIVFAIPVAFGEVMNRVWNQINSDSGDNLSQRFSANGQEPASHLIGGLPIDDATKATYPYSKTADFTLDPLGPAGAYTQQQVDDAVAALESVLLTGPTLGEAGPQALETICTLMGIQRIVLPE
jgi:hypothetical protein